MRFPVLPCRTPAALLSVTAALGAAAPWPTPLAVGAVVAVGASLLHERDGVTGLVSRRGLVRRLRSRRWQRTRYGLVAVELGPPAAVDALGRGADEVARAVGHALQRCPSVGFVSRTDTGRFVAVVPTGARGVRMAGRQALADARAIPLVAQSGLQVWAAASTDAGSADGAYPLPAGASGLASLVAVESELERARATADGWSIRAHRAADDDAVLADRLRSALLDGSLTAAFQPVVDLRDDRIVGMEALARWMDPELGIVPPDRFIAVAERSDLILDLTDRMLTLTRDCQARLRAAGFEVEAAVNVSARFLDDRLVAMLAAHPGGDLVLEVTETGLMADAALATQALDRLVGSGTRVAIDDFGVGRSSLRYLVDLPVTTLKIDRSFIDRMGDGPAFEAVVQSTLELGRRLGVEVIAEGVERPDQVAALRALGCDRIQGYVVAPPLSEGAFVALMQEREEPGGPTVPAGAIPIGRGRMG
jgi:EAL domain-containing protein (putative c-di-GMP-specific phosphodiesterase class I)